MSIMVKVELKVHENKEKELVEFFERILQDTRDFSGNVGAKISRSFEDKTKFILIEYWQAKEDFDKYLSWRTEIGDFEKLGSMLSIEPNILIFEAMDNGHYGGSLLNNENSLFP